MTDPRQLDRLRGYFHTHEHPIARPDCLEADVVAGLADGSLAGEARARALAHVASCPLCRRAVASVINALADGPITHEIEVVEGRRRPVRILRVAAPLAAAATLVLLLWSPVSDPPVHRGGQGDTRPPAPIDPIGTVAEVSALRWTRLIGSTQYRVTVFDARAAVLYETQVNDTTVTLPDSVRLIPGQLYLWKVEARIGVERWSSSELVEFTIARSPPPPE